MSHIGKAKAKGISASSFFDLKAELSKQEAEIAKSKAAGKSAAIVGGVKRPDKKPTVWARQNKGVEGRSIRDIELEALSRPTLDLARAALERKAKIYEKLKKGKSGGLTEKQYDALLVDFDAMPDAGVYVSDSDDVDESLEVAKEPLDANDPIIEYEDEFGRIRTARRSEVPRNLLSRATGEEEDDEDIVIRNPVNFYPTYEPSAERVAAIAKEHAEENNPLNVHYDASAEVRAKGAGFYQFSADEETRREQMEELRAAREETERTRGETGAVDIKAGEVEGMRDGEGSAGGTSAKSRAMEKRKRDIEERRKMIEAKRKKPNTEDQPSANADPQMTTNVEREAPSVSSAPAHDPVVSLEKKNQVPSQPPKKKGKEKATGTTPVCEADDFLAQLETDLLNSRSKKKPS